MPRAATGGIHRDELAGLTAQPAADADAALRQHVEHLLVEEPLGHPPHVTGALIASALELALKVREPEGATPARRLQPRLLLEARRQLHQMGAIVSLIGDGHRGFVPISRPDEPDVAW